MHSCVVRFVLTSQWGEGRNWDKTGGYLNAEFRGDLLNSLLERIEEGALVANLNAVNGDSNLQLIHITVTHVLQTLLDHLFELCEHILLVQLLVHVLHIHINPGSVVVSLVQRKLPLGEVGEGIILLLLREDTEQFEVQRVLVLAVDVFLLFTILQSAVKKSGVDSIGANRR